jgi:fumarate reductase flavoprotein subunit
MSENTITRRGFIAGAAATGAVVAAASAISAPEKARAKIVAEESSAWDLEEVGEPTETLTCDVAVIGGGGAGLACACQAKQLGLEPIVFEKFSFTGGSFVGVEGMFGVETHWTEEAGETQTVAEAINNCMDYHHWVPSHDLYEAFFSQTSDTIDWLEDLGVEFDHVQKYGDHTAWHIFKRNLEKGPGVSFMESMAAACDNLGIQIELECPAKKILMEDGKVVGVLCERADGTVVEVDAPVVFLATGGYANNEDFLYAVSETHNELLAPQGMTGRDADGIKMARDAGADMAEGLGTVMWCGPVIVGSTWAQPDYIASTQPVLWINEKCKRFVNEDKWENDFARVGIAQRNQKHTYSVFCKGDLDAWENDGVYSTCFSFVAAGDPMDGFTEAVEALDSVHKADTIEELAEAVGLDPDALREAVDTYNGYCADGVDPEFGKAADKMHAIDTPPYYIADIADGYYCTVGGVKVDTDCNVLDTNGEQIPGLYAGGCDAGGLYGDAYDVNKAPGSQSSWANNSGRLAAKAAAKYLGK